MVTSRTSSRQLPKLQIWLGSLVLAMSLLPVASDLSAKLAESATQAATSPEAQVMQRLAESRLVFVENDGQLDDRVRYYVQGADAALYFTDRGVRMSLSPEGTHKPAASAGDTRWVIDHAFLNAASVKPIAIKRSETTVSYFKGGKEDWHAGLATYERITYPNVWPGIDLVYRGTATGLKYDLIVQPGANPNTIALAYQHATAVATTSGGDLAITTPVGTVTDTAPIAYQGRGSTRTQVPVSFTQGGKHYGFDVGSYNRNLPLVIDPTVLVYSGFIGGVFDDGGVGIAVDPNGAAYVTGTTSSSAATFPAAGGPDLVLGGGSDAFVAKVAPNGASLTYAGYIGGDSFETGLGIAVDPAGAAYISGETTSNEASFPVTGVLDGTFNGGFTDAFVAKVAPNGASLTYAGYIGGGDQDRADGIAVDSSGAAYVTGETSSTEGSFPVTVGPDLFANGFSDAFVAKVAPAGNSLVYAGYIGGDSVDAGEGIAVDSSGAAYVAGRTGSTEGSFPVAGGPDSVHNGGIDAFVAKVAPGGGSLAYAGYIGGTNTDFGDGIAIDSLGAAYVTGNTDSPAGSFPVLGGPDLVHNGGVDAYVAKVAPSGGSLVYAGYVGGSGFDIGDGIAVDSAGAAYVTGLTSSTEASFPVFDGPDLTFDGIEDAFVTKVAPDGLTLPYSGYIGSPAPDSASGIAVDGSRAAYVTGSTGFGESEQQAAGFPTLVGPDLSHNGGSDAFVAKVSGIQQHPLTVTKAGTGQGTVTSNPAGINCGAVCASNYDEGTPVDLTPQADPGSTFAGWSGACIGMGPCQVVMNGPNSVTATFTSQTSGGGPPPEPGERPSWPLDVFLEGEGSGSVTSNPSGINCGDDCFQSYLEGTPVTLTHDAEPGSRFTGWSGDCTGAGACTVLMNKPREVTATFEPARPLNVTKSGNGDGTVTSDPGAIDCGSDCDDEYVVGNEVTLMADPDPGSELREWTGCTSVDGDECTVTIGDSNDVNARFGLIRRERRVSLFLSEHLVVTGAVRSPEGIATCFDQVPVVIERRVDGEWRSFDDVVTDVDGSFRERIEDRPGVFRAVATGFVTDGEGRCVGTHSDRASHEHDTPQQR